MSDDLFTCDGCGENVPMSEIVTMMVTGCEGDFCARCRGQEDDE